MAEQILSRKDVLLNMPYEIFTLLGKKYSIPILRTLGDSGELGFREIDVKVAGINGSPASTRSTLIELIDTGLIKQKKRRGKYSLTDTGKKVLLYAERGEKKFPLSNGGGGKDV